MVWAAVVLKKKVDWRTIKQAKNITMPKEQDIPMGVLKLSHEGLNLSKGPRRLSRRCMTKIKLGYTMASQLHQSKGQVMC
jgi:hypothetical protein